MKTNWNKAFNYIMQIKYDYLNIFNTIKEYDLNNWIDELNKEEYNEFKSYVSINCFNNMALIKYSLLDAFDKIYDENFILDECRSLVIDLENEELVLTPFKKFFNLNETEMTNYENVLKRMQHANIVEVSNKMDGSMIAARYYKNDYIISTSKNLDENVSKILKDAKSMFTDNYKQLLKNNKDYTFIFEYISQFDEHVVVYDLEDVGLHLIGARSSIDGSMISYKDVISFAKMYNIKSTYVENKSLDELLELTKTLQAKDKEGWVLNIDNNFFCKIKVDDYVEMHRILYKVSASNVIIKHIANGTFDDFYAKVPNIYKEKVMYVANLVFKYIKNENKLINDLFNSIPYTDRKEFAIFMNKTINKKYHRYMWKKFNKENINVLLNTSHLDSYKNLKDMGYEKEWRELYGVKED